MYGKKQQCIELFGDYISMDMMNRGIHCYGFILWLLCMMKTRVCVGCKGLLCGECEYMFTFACIFLSESASGHSLSEVKAVAGDAFLMKMS